MKKFISLLFFLIFLFNSLPCFSEATDRTPVPYQKDEFPQILKDLRRAEIITLGSVPFVMLTTTLVYSTIRYVQHDFNSNYSPNPFAKENEANGFSTKEQTGILLTSLGISVGIGLTDFAISAIKRSIAKKRIQKENNDSIIITPIAEDKDATRIELPIRKEIVKEESENDNESLKNKIAKTKVENNNIIGE